MRAFKFGGFSPNPRQIQKTGCFEKIKKKIFHFFQDFVGSGSFTGNYAAKEIFTFLKRYAVSAYRPFRKIDPFNEDIGPGNTRTAGAV
jgi:hypothetical protein